MKFLQLAPSAQCISAGVIVCVSYGPSDWKGF